MAPNSLMIASHAGPVVLHRDADVYRLAARVLSTLDRLLPYTVLQISRICVIGRRVVVLHLPLLDYDRAADLVQFEALGLRLTHSIGPNLIALRQADVGCRLIFDLAAPSPIKPRVTRKSLVWCMGCAKLMPYDHTHEEA